MKKRNLIGLFSLMALLLISTAFVTPEKSNPIKPGDDGGASFAEFLSHFEKTELPFSIALKDLHQSQTKVERTGKKKLSLRRRHHNPESFTKYIPEAGSMFSRMGPPIIEPVTRFYLNEKMVAVVYSTQRHFGSGIKNYSMMVYDLKGKVATKDSGLTMGSGFNLAHAYGEESTTSMIDEKGNIWKNTYKNTWKKDFNKRGFRDNEIVDSELVSTEVLRIDENGLVVELKEFPMNDRAFLD